MYTIYFRYIQSTCATSGEGLYEGLDWLSNNIANKVSHALVYDIASLAYFRFCKYLDLFFFLFLSFWFIYVYFIYVIAGIDVLGYEFQVATTAETFF
jgi:hypothetical protein